MSKNKEHMDRMAIITQWYKKHKDKIIDLEFFDQRKGNKEKYTRYQNLKMLTIEQAPNNPSIFRIVFENYYFEYIVFGYSVLDVVEEKNKLIVHSKRYYDSTERERIVLTAK